MAIINVTLADTFDQWRQKTNDLGVVVGDLSNLSGYSATDVISSLNEIKSNASFNNQININDQSNDNTTVLSTNADSMLIRVDGSDTLTITDLGDLTVANDLLVNGSINSADLTTTNNINVGAGLNVTGNTVMTGSLDLNNAIDVQGTATLQGALNVAGATALSSTLSVTGVTNMTTAAVSSSLAVSGTTTVTGTLTAQNGFVVNGNTSFEGNVTLGNAASDTITATGSFNTGLMPLSDNNRNVGSSSLRWANMYAVTFHGNATTANYADLAEKYLADGNYEAGTVMSVGGDKEVTPTTEETAHSILGVVSAFPAYLMNGNQEDGTPIALKGRVPVRVKGDVKKGDRLTISDEAGVAEANNANGVWSFAIALEDGTNLIEAVIL